MDAKKIYGYIRVSCKEQNEHRQLNELLAFGIPESCIYMDKQSGKDFNRPQYQYLIKKKLKKGNLLVVKSIDRLGRNYNEILNEWKKITKVIGCDIKILDMPLLDTQQSKDLIGILISDIVLQLLSFVAENERKTIRQRQAEGIIAARARGVRFGRPNQKLPDNFMKILHKWHNKEIPAKEAIRLSGMAYSTFYKKAREYAQNNSC